MEVTSELKLTNLTHRDIGAYQCIVENLYGATYSVKAEIQVYVFPQFVLTPEDKTVQGGTSVSLKCSATGKYSVETREYFQPQDFLQASLSRTSPGRRTAAVTSRPPGSDDCGWTRRATRT